METCQKCHLVHAPLADMHIHRGIILCPPCYIVVCYKEAGIDVLKQPIYLLDASTPEQLFRIGYSVGERVWRTCNVDSGTLEFISEEGEYDECEEAVSAGLSWGYTIPWLPKK